MRLCLLIMSLLLSLTSVAKGLTSPQQTTELCLKASAQFGSGQIKQSFETLDGHSLSKTGGVEESVKMTKDELAKIGERNGKFLETDLIKTRTAGDNFLEHIFAVKFEMGALIFSCAFYKPEDRWFLNGMHWDDNIQQLFGHTN